MELNRPADNAPQQRYGAWLAWGGRIGMALLLAGFLAYVTGWVGPHVPMERVPDLWHLPAADMLREVGLRPGWGWAELLHRSDMLMLGAIAFLASCSALCLAAVIPLFHARGERIFVAICVIEIAVLTLAASGVLAFGH